MTGISELSSAFISIDSSSVLKVFEEDVETIANQTGVSKEIAAIELEKNEGDIAETIIALTKKKN